MLWRVLSGVAAGTGAGVAGTAATDGEASVAIAALAIAGTLAGAIVLLVKIREQARTAASQATQANQAVNNVAPGEEHSLWDQVAFIREDVAELVEAQRDFAQRGWRTLPDDIATASRLTETIRSLQHADERQLERYDDIDRKLSTLHEFLRDHDRWERQEKYPDPG